VNSLGLPESRTVDDNPQYSWLLIIGGSPWKDLHQEYLRIFVLLENVVATFGQCMHWSHVCKFDWIIIIWSIDKFTRVCFTGSAARTSEYWTH